MPSELSLLTSLGTLGLAATSISGTIPPDLARLTQLTSFFMNEMALSGTIPPALFDGMDDLVYMNFNIPRLSGTLPSALLRKPNLQEVTAFNTSLSGAPLAQPITTPLLQNLNLEYAQFSGTLHDSLGDRAPLLNTLTFYQNAFSGTLPTSLTRLTSLVNLVGLGNRLSGTLHCDIGAALTSLRTLGLAQNRLSGTLPDSLGLAPALSAVSLRLNALSGSLPASFTHAPFLELDVSTNVLSGPLPPFAANGTLQSLRLSENSLSGRLSQSLLSTPHLAEIQLDSNFLSCNLPESSVGGGRLLPATLADTSGSHISLLSGNIFGCPIPTDLADGDVWGSRYSCGWSRLLGHGGASVLTAPAGVLGLSLALALAGVLSHRSVRADPMEASGVSRAVQREAKAFTAFLRATTRLAVLIAILALALGSLYASGGSPVECPYQERFTSAYLASVPTGLLETIWVALLILLLGWTYVVQGRRAMATAAADERIDSKATLVVAQGRLGILSVAEAGVAAADSGEAGQAAAAGAPQPTDVAVVACDLASARRAAGGEYTLLAFATSAEARHWCDALGSTEVGAAPCTVVLDAAPEDVHWSNVLGVAAKPIKVAEALWRRAVLVVGMVFGLSLGLAPNALFVLVESGIIDVQSGLPKQLVTIAVSAAKVLLGSLVLPLLATRLTSMLWLPTRPAYGATAVATLVALNFTSSLFWPIGATLLLDPTCYYYALFPHSPVTLVFPIDKCYVLCPIGYPEFPIPDCPNACGFRGCLTCEVHYESTDVQPPFVRNPSCPSTAISIYGPVFLLVFAGLTIANALRLLLSALFPPALPEQPTLPPPSRFARLRAHICGRLARLRVRMCGPLNDKLKSPTLNLIKKYVDIAQSLAIVASFGVVYPLVAVVGAFKLCVDLYTLPRQLAALGVTHGAKLRTEGVTNLPTVAIVAVAVVSLGVLHFVWGPYGMLNLDGANAIVISATVTVLPLVFFSRELARMGLKRWEQTPPPPAINALLVEEAREGALAEFVASFEVWVADNCNSDAGAPHLAPLSAPPEASGAGQEQQQLQRGGAAEVAAAAEAALLSEAAAEAAAEAATEAAEAEATPTAAAEAAAEAEAAAGMSLQLRSWAHRH